MSQQTGTLSTPDAWNDVAEGYVLDNVPLLSLYAKDAIALAQLPPDARVLDVAAGPGTLSLLAAREARSVVAIDFAEAMTEECRRRAAEEGLINVEVMVGDGQALPFEDESFDAAFLMFGLMFFPDRAAGLRELRRVLKPGGRAVVSSWAPMTEVPLLASLSNQLAVLLPDLPFGREKAPLSEADTFGEEMAAAGFHSVEIMPVKHDLDIPSIRAFWTAQLRSSAPIALLRRKFSDTEWSAMATTIVAGLEEEFGTGSLKVEWPALLGVGVR
jgi:SAM-dependent methyltransferase